MYLENSQISDHFSTSPWAGQRCESLRFPGHSTSKYCTALLWDPRMIRFGYSAKFWTSDVESFKIPKELSELTSMITISATKSSSFLISFGIQGGRVERSVRMMLEPTMDTLPASVVWRSRRISEASSHHYHDLKELTVNVRKEWGDNELWCMYLLSNWTASRLSGKENESKKLATDF